MKETATEITLPEGYGGWDGTDPFEDHAGPYYFKEMEDGSVRCAFISTPTHCNGGGFIHGGALMTFADYALFAIAKDVTEGPCVTVSFNSEFVSAGPAGKLIEATGEVVRNTKSLIFVRGEIICEDDTLMTFSGIIKRVGRRA
ncbi:PaaI family thioesterase [Tepidicaulis sp. LMO-SS28]|uniref:PaaI family thioesterase n=1 Tax=Tepidicaulis sp. LMO-SS28 TaxID=3447455 RepID=UPI003EDECF6B